MELRDPTGNFARVLIWILVIILILATVYTLNQMSTWQNSIRLRMEMEPIDSAYPLTVFGVAIVTALVFILLARLILFAATKAVGVIHR